EARGPTWKLPPLPFVPPGSAATVPAVPIGIRPRLPGADVALVPPLPDAASGDVTAPPLPRPARSAETSPSKPLALRLRAVPSENTILGPGEWLKIRASASVPCYVVVFHVSGDRHVKVLFPRRFDLVYEPNVSYTLADRSNPGESGEIVVAVACVYPMTAADALAALRSSRALAPAASGPFGPELSAAPQARL